LTVAECRSSYDAHQASTRLHWFMRSADIDTKT
jgi:hypothetical protein